MARPRERYVRGWLGVVAVGFAARCGGNGGLLVAEADDILLVDVLGPRRNAYAGSLVCFCSADFSR